MAWSLASPPIKRASLVAVVLQLILVVAGHAIPAVADQFPFVGTALSALGGLLYGLWDKGAHGLQAAAGGAAVGGLTAFLGILTAFALGDTIGSVLVFGTASGGVAGAVGGVLGHMLRGPSAA